MQVSIEKKEGINCVINIEVPSNEIDQEVITRIKNISKTIKMDGFRPGKIPLNIVKNRHSHRIRMEVISEILPKKYNQVISDKNLRVASAEFKILQNVEGKNLQYTANIQLFPNINITNLKNIKIKKPVVTIGDAEIKKTIENIRIQFSTWHKVDRPVDQKDKVFINFFGSIDGKKFENSSAKNFELIIGSNQMIPGFEEGIIKMQKNQKKIITLKLPENYHIKELSGKQAKFDILVTSIEERKLPKLNENLFKKLGVKGDISNFYKEIKKNMSRELSFALEKYIKQEVLLALNAYFDIEIPQVLIDKEMIKIKKDFIQYIEKRKKSKIDFKKFPNKVFRKRARENVKSGLIINAIIEKQGFQADQESINHMIEKIISIYEDPKAIRNKLQRNDSEMNNIKNRIIEKKAIDWVVSQAEISKKSEDFFTLIQNTFQ